MEEYDLIFKFLTEGGSGEEVRDVKRSIRSKAKNYKVQDGLLYYQKETEEGTAWRVVIKSEDERKKIMEWCHGGEGGNEKHLSRDKTRAKVSELFYWPRVISDVDEFVKHCEKCHHRNRGPKDASQLDKAVVLPASIAVRHHPDKSGDLTPVRLSTSPPAVDQVLLKPERMPPQWSLDEFQPRHPSAVPHQKSEEGTGIPGFSRLPVAPPPTVQPPPPQSRREYEARQSRFSDGLLSLLAGNLLPPSMVHNPHFRNFISMFDPRMGIPRPDVIEKTLLPMRRVEEERSIEMALMFTPSICLTLDIWSTQQGLACLGISGHFIDHDWNAASRLLRCANFNGTPKPEDIVTCVEDTQARFSLCNKTECILVGSINSIISANRVTLPGLSEDDKLAADDKDSSTSSTSDENELLTEVVNFEEIGLPSSCIISYANALQECIEEGMVELHELAQVFAKASHYAVYLRLTINKPRLLKVPAYKWTEQVKTIRSVLACRESSQSIPLQFTLTITEKNQLQEFLDIIEPFEEALSLVQRPGHVSVSFILPSYRCLQRHLANFKATYSSCLVAKLQESLERRFQAFEGNTLYVFSAILDPNFKLRWCSTSEGEAYKDALEFELRRVAELEENDSTPELLYSHSDEPPNKRSKLFKFLDNGQVSERKLASVNPSAEIDKHLNSIVAGEISVLEYWRLKSKEMPLMNKLARKLLCVPANPSSVKKLFEIDGKILTPPTQTMKPETWESMVLIKANMDIKMAAMSQPSPSLNPSVSTALPINLKR